MATKVPLPTSAEIKDVLTRWERGYLVTCSGRRGGFDHVPGDSECVANRRSINGLVAAACTGDPRVCQLAREIESSQAGRRIPALGDPNGATERVTDYVMRTGKALRDMSGLCKSAGASFLAEALQPVMRGKGAIEDVFYAQGDGAQAAADRVWVVTGMASRALYGGFGELVRGARETGMSESQIGVRCATVMAEPADMLNSEWVSGDNEILAVLDSVVEDVVDAAAAAVKRYVDLEVEEQTEGAAMRGWTATGSARPCDMGTRSTPRTKKDAGRNNGRSGARGTRSR